MENKRLNRKKTGSGFKKQEVIFMVLMLALPMFYHILNTYILGFYNIFYTFQQYDSQGNLYWVGFQNFRTVVDMLSQLEGGLVFTSLTNSLLVWFLQNIVMFPLTMLFSFYIAKGYPGNKIIRFGSMIPTMIGGLVLSQVFINIAEGPLSQAILMTTGNSVNLLQDLDTAKTTLIVYLLWSGFGSCLIIYPNAMNAIDKNIVEASELDGASLLKQLWHVYLPGMWPTITVMYFNAMGTILTADLPNFLFYGYSAPPTTYTLGYYIFNQTMKGAENMGPVLNALNYMIAMISIPLTILWKRCAERYGPSEDEPKRRKRRSAA